MKFLAVVFSFAKKLRSGLLSTCYSDFSIGDAILDDGGFGVGEGLDFLEGFGMEAPEIAGLEDLDRQASLDEMDSTLTDKKDKDLKDEEMVDQATKDKEVVEEISTIMGEAIEDNHKMDSEDEGQAGPEQTGFYF